MALVSNCLQGIMLSPLVASCMLEELSLSSNDESLVLGEGVDEDVMFLRRFFTVEFQKFLISLSVLPGNRAAI